MGELVVGDAPGEFGEGVGLQAGRGGQLGSGGGGGGEADDGVAGGLPGRREGVHGGGLARSGRRDRELHEAPRRGQLLHQRSLPGVEGETPLGG